MSISNITVKNGSNVDVTYTALQPQSGAVPALWVAKAGARNVQANLRMDVRPRASKAVVDRITLVISMPIMDAVSGLTRTYTANVSVLAPVSGTDIEMTDFVTQFTGLISNVQIQGFLKNVQPPV